MTELLIVLKATLLFLLGLTATGLAGGWRASRRHIMLAATFTGVLILPLTGLLLPPISLGVDVPRIAQPAVAPSLLPSVETSRQAESVTQTQGKQQGGTNGVTILRIVWAMVVSTLL